MVIFNSYVSLLEGILMVSELGCSLGFSHETWECNLVTLVKNNNPIQHEKQFIFEQF